MNKKDALDALRKLGFNDLEAEVYIFLLRSSPLTAYRVGRALGRATANVYKAVESLARRGAVIVEEGDQRMCRAIPPADLTRQLEQSFKTSIDHAKTALYGLAKVLPDERVYKIESVSQLFDRCSEMLAHAEHVAVVDAFPRALSRITPWITAACERGVEVFVEAYKPIEVFGARVVVAPSWETVLEHWHSEQLNIVVDGREHLLSLLSSDLEEIHQAVWSNSLYLSCIHHAGRLCEHTLVGVMAKDNLGQPEEALTLLRQHRFFINSEVPGQRELLARYLPKSTELRSSQSGAKLQKRRHKS